jgi:hypothetical protein
MTARYFSAVTLRLLGRWLAWSTPIPYITIASASLTLSDVDVPESLPAFAVMVFLVDLLQLLPFALALAGWIALLRCVPRCATSRAWHLGSLVALCVLTVNGIVLSIWAFNNATSDNSVHLRDSYSAVFQASPFGDSNAVLLWIGYLLNPFLVVLVPRLLLARRLRANGLVAYPSRRFSNR